MPTKHDERKRRVGVDSDLSLTARVAALAPFRVRSFRFQWPADLVASWAFEMEAILLGWYVLVETGSVLWLAMFGSLQFLGTLIAPLLGMLGDRIGYRNLLCLMRAAYASFAAILMFLTVTGLVSAWSVFVVGIIAGLVRPSDLVMRNLLVGERMPPAILMQAMAVSRTTADSARVVGALAGAATVAALGMGPAYVVVVVFYLLSLLLTLGISATATAAGDAPAASARPRPEARISTSPLRDLQDGLAYVWRSPHLRAAIYLAFLVNLTAYPLVGALLAHVARDIYGMDQTGLGWLVASFSGGALLGSLILSTHGAFVRPARIMIACGALWFVATLAFVHAGDAFTGSALLILCGLLQSFCLVPMAGMLLRTTALPYRGRVMGVRMFAVYGLPVGLLAAGPLVAEWGFAVTGTIYSLVGLFFVGVIAWRWHRHLWPPEAPANAR